MNAGVLFVRVWGKLIPIKQVTLVQVSPNTGAEIQEIPLTKPLKKLMEHNLVAFVQIPTSRSAWLSSVGADDE